MREFSQFERDLIRTKLLEGSGLSTLFDDGFLKEVKIMVRYNGDSVKFEFYSDALTANEIYDTVVDVIDLLKYLLDNGLVRRHYQPATDLSTYNSEGEISIGDSMSAKSVAFLIPEDLHYLTSFIRKNRNSIFRATEPLKTLVAHNFLSLEVRIHNQNVRLQRIANGITLLIALATIAFANYQNKTSYDDLNFKVGKLSAESRHLSKERIQDSLLQISIQKEVEGLRKEIQDLKTQIETSAQKRKGNAPRRPS